MELLKNEYFGEEAICVGALLINSIANETLRKWDDFDTPEDKK